MDKKFQSTQPEWAATGCRTGRRRGRRYFNPRSPSGLRPNVLAAYRDAQAIFQSTQPEWAATAMFHRLGVPIARISIHAARVGCDGLFAPPMIRRPPDFNPRSPSGLRPPLPKSTSRKWQFQSTQPEWAATNMTFEEWVKYYISIHAARVGCDNELAREHAPSRRFQSTQPEWAATVERRFNNSQLSIISIHAARVGCDCF